MQTFTRRIIFNFSQFPVPHKKIVTRPSRIPYLAFLLLSWKWESSQVGTAGMEVIYRNSASRTGRSLQLMLTSSSLSSTSSSSSSSFSFSSPPRPLHHPLHRPLHTARNIQTGKFRRWKLRVAAAKLPSSARYKEGVNASAPRVADQRRAASGVRNGSWCSRAHI